MRGSVRVRDRQAMWVHENQISKTDGNGVDSERMERNIRPTETENQ